MNNLNKLVSLIENKFSKDYVDCILLYIEYQYEYILNDLNNTDEKSNVTFNSIVNILDKIPTPIKIKYGIKIDKFLFLDWSESDTILIKEIENSINDVKHLGHREFLLDITYINFDNEHTIQNLNLNHFPELKGYDIIDVTFSKLSKTDYLILTKQ